MVQQMKRECETGTSNEQYDLISIMYHALQCAAVSNTYIQDADDSGDQELKAFFEQVKQQSCQQAEKAKQLMAKRMSM
jgi:hypothetical protein